MKVPDDIRKTPPPTRILIADDHDKMREAIREFVEECRGLEVVGEARNGASAVELARRLRPHVVLMDFHMPVMDGGEATRAIRRELPDVKIIGLSVHPNTHPLMREAGVCSCLEKSEITTQLYPAVRNAMGHGALSPARNQRAIS